MNKKFLSFSALVALIVVLSNCDWFKPKPVIEKESSSSAGNTAPSTVATGEVLLTIDGKPKVTVSEFEDYKKTILEAHPDYKQIAGIIPNFEQEIFNSMVNELVIQHFIKENKIDQHADFQKDRAMGIEFLDRQLAIKYFQEEYPKIANIQVTDAEARKVYDERKESTPGLMISRGGIAGKLVEFKTEDQAKPFFEKVSVAGADFDKIAKDQGLAVRDLKEVTLQSFDVDGPIREKLVAAKKFPSVEMVKGKDKVWVIKAVSKKEAEYVPFDQVKEPIKQQLKTQKLLTEELEKLKKKFNLEENKEYFERIRQDREAAMEKMKEEAQKQMEKKGDEKTKKSATSIQGA